MIDFEKIKFANKTLSAELRFFLLLLEEACNGIFVDLPLNLIESELAISHSTMKNYLKNFKAADLLKFAYKKNIVVNPDCFNFDRGQSRELELAIYDNYLSD